MAYDLRGHGMSQAPSSRSATPTPSCGPTTWPPSSSSSAWNGRCWSAWSYGGYIICDYLRAHGQDRIGAIDFAGGATKLGPAAFGTLIGPGFLDHFADFTADDLPTNIRGMRGLVAAFAATPLPADDVETLLCSAMTVPARIRANLGAREIDGDDVLRTLRVPLLVSQGRADTIVLPAMAEHILATCPTAEASWYEGVGRTPFLEDPERFNRELAALARRVSSSSSTQ